MRLFQYLRRMCINKLKKRSKFVIPSCSRYLARVIYKLHLNTWNTKYSQNVTCVCKKYPILSVKHILLECPIYYHSYFRRIEMTLMLATTKEIYFIILILSILLLN